jgi:flagellar biosynthetic protein FliQ
MDYYFAIAAKALTVALMIAGPILGVALIVGLGVSVLQAVTGVQEMTLAFIPKLLAVGLLLFLLGPWILDQMRELIEAIASALAAGPR